MISFIEEHYESLNRLCEQYRVKRFEIFGSALTGEGFDPEKQRPGFLSGISAFAAGRACRCLFWLA